MKSQVGSPGVSRKAPLVQPEDAGAPEAYTRQRVWGVHRVEFMQEEVHHPVFKVSELFDAKNEKQPHPVIKSLEERPTCGNFDRIVLSIILAHPVSGVTLKLIG